MPSVNKPRRRIDERKPGAAVGTPLGDNTPVAPPSIGILSAPSDLQVIETGVYQSSVAALAFANLRWRPPVGVPLQRHVVRWSQSADFASFLDVPADTSGVAGIVGLPAGATVWFKVAAIGQNGQQSAFSAAVSALMSQDLTPPAAPTELSYLWRGRDGLLSLRCTVPTNANVRGVQYDIYSASPATGGVLVRSVVTPNGLFSWTHYEQRANWQGAGLGDPQPSIYILARTLTWNQTYSSPVTLQATCPLPSEPFANTSWTTPVDTGIASADLRVGITSFDTSGQQSTTFFVVRYEQGFGIRQYTVPVSANTYHEHVYSYDINRVLVPPYGDPTITVTVFAYSIYGQVLTTGPIAAINYPPPPTTITASGVANTVVLSIAPSLAQDLRGYRVRVYKNGTELAIRTFEVTSTTVTYAVQDGDGSYQFSVAPVDLFNQYGTESALTTPITLEVLTLDDIREAAIYSDSVDTAPATLKAQLADDDRDSGGIAYFAPSTAWQWVQVDRQLQDRLGPTILAASGGASSHGLGYLAISQDAVTWRFYAGPATGGTTLAFKGSGALGSAAETSARANAVTLPLVASSQLWILPDVQEARYIRLGFYSVMFPANITLYEFYPQSLIVADQILGGTIRGLKMIGNEIEGGVITGAQIRTAATGQRVEMTPFGLRTYNTAGDVVIEAGVTADGALRSGSGLFQLNRTGLVLRSDLDAGGNYLSGGLVLTNQDDETRGILYVEQLPFQDGNLTLNVDAFGGQFKIVGTLSVQGSIGVGVIGVNVVGFGPLSAASVGSGLFIDSADGDLKIKFANGVTKTIATND